MSTTSRLSEVKAQWHDAVERMQDVGASLSNAATDSDPDVVASLQSEFDAAEAEVRKFKDEHDRQERIASARAEVYRTSPTESNTSTNTPLQPGGLIPSATGGNVSVRVKSEPLTYERNAPHSFVWDMANKDANPTAAERLRRHAHEMAVERRDLNSTATSGGDFIAPVHLADQWLDVARASRVTANLGQYLGAPPRAASFTIPRITSDPGVGVQASDNAAVTETDAVTASLTVARATIAGLQDVSQQALDDSSPGLDQLLFNALAQKYALQINSQVISGSGSSGQIRGITNTSGIIAVAYTDADPTGAEFMTAVGKAISQVSTQRFQAPSVVVMHPRRWFWLASQSDTAGRPLVVPAMTYAGTANQAVNAQGVYSVTTGGMAGYLQGLPVYLDPGIPTNLGAGTNEDTVFVMRAEDLMRWEDAVPRAETFREVLSSTLTVRLRVYGYAAFTAGAYTKGIAQISGTGLIGPTGF